MTPKDRPLHVAIIMDGNGRWAKKRGLPRTFGHREGVKALKRVVESAPDHGVGILTVFGFSTENWRRPVAEVSELMNLLKSYVSAVNHATGLQVPTDSIQCSVTDEWPDCSYNYVSAHVVPLSEALGHLMQPT